MSMRAPEDSRSAPLQTMERIALETAAKSDETLHALWEAVMPLIPEESAARIRFNPEE